MTYICTINYNSLKTTILPIMLLCSAFIFAQHNNEFYNNGALVHVQAGAEVYILGDQYEQVNSTLENYGLIQVHGNSYSSNTFQQRGTGTYRVQNSTANVGERQFISGSYAVRGGQAQTGVNDGSFYNLELANDQGIVYLVGTGNIADVRGAVNFWAGTFQNRIITHDVGITGALVYPANGSGYSAIFGIMNATSGLGSMTNNTVSLNGNMSGIDNGYIQGKFRRAINFAGGTFNYVMGVEPAGPLMQRGMQYVLINFGANNYDVVTGYFESGSSNATAPGLECGGNTIDYFGGTDSGEWFFTDNSGGAGTYQVQVWPQDDNLIAASVWMITKNNSYLGTANDCGPSPVALPRSGFNGFNGEFGVAAPSSLLPIELIDINAVGIVDHIDVTWNVASEVNLSHYELERSEDGNSFEHIANINPTGGANILQSYTYNDFDVRYFQDYYYRVRSVDFDGAFDYSPIVVAKIYSNGSGLDENAVTIYPNPSFGNFALSIYSSEMMNIEMEVHNSLGQVVSSKQFVAQKGNTALNIESSEWAPAVYYVTLRDTVTGQKITKKFIKN